MKLEAESRVGLTPAGVKTLSDYGHTVLVERGAGEGSGISDEEYQVAAGQIIDSADAIWERADMVVKVKEPVGPEYLQMREGQILFTYLHLAPDPKLTRAMLDLLRPGAVVVDVAIDQGGCFETSRETTHTDPVYAVWREDALRHGVASGIALPIGPDGASSGVLSIYAAGEDEIAGVTLDSTGEWFRVLEWAERQPGLAETLARVQRRARASAHRYNARYLLDGGQPRSALRDWSRALFIHPPTALARINILVSAVLSLVGLGRLREAVLRRRQRKFSGQS